MVLDKDRPKRYNFKDRVGEKFGRLRVVSFAGVGDSESYWSCLCSCGRTLAIKSSNLVSGNTTSCGCYHKDKVTGARVPKEVRTKCVEDSTNYTVISARDGRAESKWLFNCAKHGAFEKSFSKLLSGQGCPSCASHGFNISKPAHLYILSVSTCGEVVCYKVGITNNDVDERASVINRNTDLDVCVFYKRYFEVGAEASNIECCIKSTFAKPLLSRQEFPDGFTELFSTEDIIPVIKQINKYKETIKCQ